MPELRLPPGYRWDLAGTYRAQQESFASLLIVLIVASALVRAGRTRFRPLLMTGLTTIFGLAPLALGLGPGAQMQQPLAIAVIGGLIVNTLLTRLLIPVGYLALQGKRVAAAERLPKS